MLSLLASLEDERYFSEYYVSTNFSNIGSSDGRKRTLSDVVSWFFTARKKRSKGVKESVSEEEEAAEICSPSAPLIKKSGAAESVSTSRPHSPKILVTQEMANQLATQSQNTYVGFVQPVARSVIRTNQAGSKKSSGTLSVRRLHQQSSKVGSVYSGLNSSILAQRLRELQIDSSKLSIRPAGPDFDTESKVGDPLSPGDSDAGSAYSYVTTYPSSRTSDSWVSRGVQVSKNISRKKSNKISVMDQQTPSLSEEASSSVMSLRNISSEQLDSGEMSGRTSRCTHYVRASHPSLHLLLKDLPQLGANQQPVSFDEEQEDKVLQHMTLDKSIDELPVSNVDGTYIEDLESLAASNNNMYAVLGDLPGWLDQASLTSTDRQFITDNQINRWLLRNLREDRSSPADQVVKWVMFDSARNPSDDPDGRAP